MEGERARIQARALELLAGSGVEFALFTHQPVTSYADAELARVEAGFSGTEGKVVITGSDAGFAAFLTLQHRRVDLRGLRRLLGTGKQRLATPDDLARHFATVPGAAYPFGFDDAIPLVVDPLTFDEAQLLYGMPDPTTTLQIPGLAFRALVDFLPNPVFTLESIPATRKREQT